MYKFFVNFAKLLTCDSEIFEKENNFCLLCNHIWAHKCTVIKIEKMNIFCNMNYQITIYTPTIQKGWMEEKKDKKYSLDKVQDP
jgi:hypothetical protein